MDFKDRIKQLGEKVLKLKEVIGTEEATKNAFIMPFLQALEYDVFNPLEIVPECPCDVHSDVGIKKGEKIDYAIMKDSEPIMLIECKHWKQDLSLHDGQLLRYFHVSKAKFGLLTNGIVYRFYTDLESPNIMDRNPFLEFNITEIQDSQIEELKKFHKSYFNVENIQNTASELKYMGLIKKEINQIFDDPQEDFVKFIIPKVYLGRATAGVVSQFMGYVKKATQSFIEEKVDVRLKNALKKDSDIKDALNETSLETPHTESKIITTDEEKEAFFIVKSIFRQKIDSNRICHRDQQSYFGILLDDNNRKPICRLYLDGSKKLIGIFDENKKETKYQIENIGKIYDFEAALIKTVEFYDKDKSIQ
jgi:hypothetical protein